MSYIEVAGLSTWHEVTGTGLPVVLLHGGLFGASGWSAQTTALVAAGFRVHTPERRGHARTPDLPGPLTYSAMADDTIAYLETVACGPAHLIGWSDGAVVGMLVAQRRPELVRRLILIGQYYNSSGKTPEMADVLASGASELLPYVRPEYEQLSPDGPDHLQVFFDKTIKMWQTEPEIELSSLSSVSAQTLILQGDRDLVTVEHSQAVVKALPDARLAVLPGTHGLPIESPAVVNQLLIAFLENGPPTSSWA